MKEHFIKNIKNTRIEFFTLSKKDILTVFNYKCKSIHKIKEEDFIIIDGKLCLPIDLPLWKDIDDDTDFVNVLKAIERITNPEGGNPALVIKAKLLGFDIDKKCHFTFKDTFMNGKHCIVGEYSNGEKMIYTDNLYLQ